jgi:transposase
MLLDNFPSHHSHYFTINAKFKGVKLIFVPKYTPRLNPAETPIREIRRFLSPNYLETADKIKEKVIQGFNIFIKDTKCAIKWIKKHWIAIN